MGCTFNQAKELVKQLVIEKGFPNDDQALMQKLLWAFVELGEATNAFKKGGSWDVIIEELIDTIFYILDFIGLVEETQRLNIDVDRSFMDKWKKNMNRPMKYGQKRGFPD